MTFYELLKDLLPAGPYSDDDAGTTLRSLYVKALGLERTEGNLNALSAEIFPDTAEALLGEWERVYGIDADADSPVYIREQLLVAKINARPGLSIKDIQEALYPFLGYYADITEKALFRCDDPQSLCDRNPLVEPEEEVYRFLVMVDGARITTPGFSRDAVQAFLNEIKPAHTQGDIVFSMFACDDPNSLCDRDLLVI